MRKRLFKMHFFCLLITCLALTACGGGGGSDDRISNSGTGTLTTALTDSTTDQYKAIYVTIERVEVHHDESGQWETVASPDATYNLLELINGVQETLGTSTLEAGHYTQMRLIIGSSPDQEQNILGAPHPFANYLVLQNDDAHELKIPSGTNTGLKLINGFDITADQTTELILDFDALQSVVKAGANGKYLLKPTIKIRHAEEGVMVSGRVEAATEPPPLLEGAHVTAQSALDPDDPTDLIEAGTLSDENGGYALFLEAGSYHLVATKNGYFPACTGVSLTEGDSASADFSLSPVLSALGTVSGTIFREGEEAEQDVKIEFRQVLDCGDAGDQTVVIQTIRTADASYSAELPEGDYHLVASAEEKEPIIIPITIITGEPLTADLDFL